MCGCRTTNACGANDIVRQDVKLENIKITNADKGFTVHNTRGLMCANVTVNGKIFNVPTDAKLESHEPAAN